MTQPAPHPFGVTSGGKPVEVLTLDNGILSCRILTFGAALQSLFVPDRAGRRVDVVLGYETLEEYQTWDGYFGAVVGRYANRIASGRFSLHGQTYSLACNNGPNHLHGGLVGFSHRVWTLEELSDSRAVLCLDSPDGEEGYPGHLQVKLTYQLIGNALELRYESVTDRDTPCSLTNHSYFNLASHDSGPVLDQELCLFAQAYTPADETSIPTGAIQPVEGTPMDLRALTPIRANIAVPFSQLVQAKGFDHNYVVDGRPGTLRPAARAYASKSGIVMDVDTTLPGIQLYTANYVEEGRPGKNGAHYGPRHAFCLETQFFPDSPNHPAFPSCVLKAEERREDVTRYIFSACGFDHPRIN